MKNSLKQLLRTPMKAVLFFLLIAACTLLLVFGTSMFVQTNERIEAAEREFATVATVEQMPDAQTVIPVWHGCTELAPQKRVDVYDELLLADLLDFPGAEYIVKPENLPCYFSQMPPSFHKLGMSPRGTGVDDEYILEFTALEDSSTSRKITVRVEKFLYFRDWSGGVLLPIPEEGGEMTICCHFCENPTRLEAGKRYIANVGYGYSWSDPFISNDEYVLMPVPFSTQCGKDGLALESDVIETGGGLYERDGSLYNIVPNPFDWLVTPTLPIYIEEVTEDFYDEGGRGQLWLNWVKAHEVYISDGAYLRVQPTNSLKVLPSFHERQVYMAQGREITAEEFEQGTEVCVLPERLLERNMLQIGDKIPLSLVCSYYNSTGMGNKFTTFDGEFSLLNAQGELYSPFWEAEYEIVGAYKELDTIDWMKTELRVNNVIIPAKSVRASDEKNIIYYAPMNAQSVWFQIPNGSIEDFDAALREAVPEVEKLNITYDDNGYTDVINSLNNARMTAVLLLAVGVIAALAIVMLLLYFFIVKQKKRTAIERSLGMSKKQCRVSLLAGLLVLTLIAAVLGSACGAVILSKSDSAVTTSESVDTAGYDTTYSVWAKNANMRNGITLEASVPVAVYVAIPVALTAFVLVLALVLIERNLKIEPILLLSGKME